MHYGNKNLVSILKDCKYNSFDMFDEALSVAMNNDLSTIHNMDFSDNRRMLLEFIRKLGNQNDDVPVYYAVYFVGGKDDLYKKIDYVLEAFYDIINDYRSDCIIVNLIINASNNPDSDWNKWVNVNQTTLLTTTINEVRKFKEMHFKFTVIAEVNDSMLRSEIVLDYEMEMGEVQFLFYLYRDGVVIEKGQWGDCNCKEWKLTQDGIYCTQGYVRGKDFRVYKRSVPISYFTEKTVGSYRDFMDSSADCEEDSTLLYNTLPFVKSEYPFADFIICSENADGPSKELKECVNDFVERFSSFSQREFRLGDSNIYICTDGGLVINNDERMRMFSGISIIDNKVVIGANDISETVDQRMLSEGYGSYTAVDVDVNDKSVHIFRDGFGLGKWFVYRDDNVFCLSNNYHSFLLFLKSIKRELSVDIEKCAVLLSSERVQLLNQTICRQMDVKQVEQISEDYIYTFSGGWKKEKTWYGNLITSKIPYHEEEYQKYVKEAITEMLNNIKIIYEDSRFDYIISDLSGGIDSRLVYALLTNLNSDYKSRTRILSHDLPGTEDLKIATEINSVFGMQYDNLPRRVIVKSLREADAYMRSRELGIYFSFDSSFNWLFPYKHIHEKYSYLGFQGALGEVEMRPYATRHYINRYDDHDMSPEDFATIILEDISYKIDAPCNDTFISFIKQEIKSIDSLSLYETYESMYRQYYIGSHHNYQLYFECEEKRWPVLQSKTAMILHHIMINSFRSVKLHFDLIAEANPILLGFRYDYKKNTDDYVELRDYILTENRYKSIRNIHGNSDYAEAWQQAGREKIESLEKIKNGDGVDYSDELYNSEIEKRSRYLLRKLLRYSSELEKMIGIELFYYLKKGNVNWQVFYNKLASITDQLTLISSL